ncbi:hypothetical protein H4R34_000488 [Dimargaris verticillata]|uniref:Small RNA 2'-O-methyltransferase n=1 Tax=Dimargaris verticillata TaxID=2761393 RepID=A0A9W8B820_9FUNG|nr:hypothetical protein H4R34_000488 [Dimargaris verticillata]
MLTIPIPLNPTGDSTDQAPLFTPALWVQRRRKVADKVYQAGACKVLDLGCGEGSLLSFLISPHPDVVISHLYGMDIDREALGLARANCDVTDTDYRDLRPLPLTIDLYHGSLANPCDALVGVDCITFVEVIEHLYPETLECVGPVALGYYQPSTFIVTTPNAEFNVHFPNLKYDTQEATFRHDDHKFEWTRAEFRQWCESQCERYNYAVAYDGVGYYHGKQDAPEGPCTQIAVFTRATPRNNEANTNAPLLKSQQPQLLCRIILPSYTVRLDRRAIHAEIDLVAQSLVSSTYLAQVLLHPDIAATLSADCPAGTTEIPLDEIWSDPTVRRMTKTRRGLIEYLVDHPSFQVLTGPAFRENCLNDSTGWHFFYPVSEATTDAEQNPLANTNACTAECDAIYPVDPDYGWT